MIKEPQQPIVDNFINVRQPAMSGLNTINDVHDIKDQESPDMLNVMFDAGVVGPRQGSKLYAAKPSTEMGSPLQTFVFKASDGTEYTISVYSQSTGGYNFYLWDILYSRWMLINGKYLPTLAKNTRMGYQSWDNGYGSDRGYFCNGTDDMMRWRMQSGSLSKAALSTDSILNLVDSSRFNTYTASISSLDMSNSNYLIVSNLGTEPSFPLGQLVYYQGSGIVGLNPGLYYTVPQAGSNGVSFALATTLANAKSGAIISISGTPTSCFLSRVEPIVLYDGATYTYALYYSNASNVLILTAPLGTAMGPGSSVTSTITDRPGSNRGKVLARYQSRLVAANGSPGTEVTMNYSRIGEPEDYITQTDDIASGGSEVFNDGFGGIIAIHDFGQFLAVLKQDTSYAFSFTLNSDLGSQISNVQPLISGKGMGPIVNSGSVKALNSIYYPTTLSGFINLSPVSTGYSITAGVQVISYNINNYVQTNLDLSGSVGMFYRNKILWTSKTTAQPVVMVYDLVRNAWTRIDSWNPTDLFTIGTNLYYMSAIDGNIYQAFSGYTDNNNAYISYFFTKLNNFGVPAYPKTMDAIYVEGYMTQSTTLYCDVWYNEGGKLNKQTYKMAYGVTGFSFANTQIDALGQLPFNQGVLDSLLASQIGTLGFFRCYLSVPNAVAPYAVQAKFYSKDADSVWFLVGYSMNPQVELALPAAMRVDSTVPFTTNFATS